MKKVFSIQKYILNIERIIIYLVNFEVIILYSIYQNIYFKILINISMKWVNTSMEFQYDRY